MSYCFSVKCGNAAMRQNLEHFWICILHEVCTVYKYKLIQFKIWCLLLPMHRFHVVLIEISHFLLPILMKALMISQSRQLWSNQTLQLTVRWDCDNDRFTISHLVVNKILDKCIIYIASNDNLKNAYHF